MDKIEGQAQKEASKIWNEILKDDFTNYVDNIFNDSMKKFESQMKDFLQSIKSEKTSEKSQPRTNLVSNRPVNPLSAHGKNQNNEAPKQNTSEPSDFRSRFLGPSTSNTVNNSIKTEDSKRNQIINGNNKGFPFKNLALSTNSNPLIKLVLHSLSNMKPLLKFYLNQPPFPNLPVNQINLSNSFHKLIGDYWNNNNGYSPNDIDQILRSLMNNYYNTNDPGLIFQTFLNRINIEEGSNSININNTYVYNNSYNYNVIMQYLTPLYTQNKTKIEQCLYNIILNKKICKSCRREQFFLHHEPIINLYLKQMNFNNNSIDLISLTKINDNGNFENCANCRNQMINSISIYDTSKIIIFNIKRDYVRNIMINVNYPSEFAKNNLVNQNGPSPIYELIGVIHKNVFNNFILNMKSSNGQWYCYDNDKISQGNYFDQRNVYTLIYQLKES